MPIARGGVTLLRSIWSNEPMAITFNWTEPAWLAAAEARIDEALAGVDRPRTGPLKAVPSSGCFCVMTAPTQQGRLWTKHCYGLPPGEQRVLEALSERWAHRLPVVVVSWPGAVIMEAFPGRELSPADRRDHWVSAAAAIAEIAASERTLRTGSRWVCAIDGPRCGSPRWSR